MGGDFGLPVTIPACVRMTKKNPQITFVLVGDENQIHLALAHLNIAIDQPSGRQFQIVHASEVVGMDELPSQVLRNKKDSSMRVAINLVKEGRAAACVSSGNTGALMGIARFVLKTLPGIDRPAIIAKLPTKKGCTLMVDLGANVDSCAEHLFQFAVMGSALIQALEGVKRPKITLLNIGVEEIKGNDQVKRTAHMLAECQSLNYVGYIEGDQIFSGDVDLVVCDGFDGNVALKASEGLARLMLSALKSSFNQNIWMRMIGLLAKPALLHFKNTMDPTRYNGATLLGLNGIVVKSHGSASAEAFEYAIEEAVAQVENNVIPTVRDVITEFVNQGLML